MIREALDQVEDRAVRRWIIWRAFGRALYSGGEITTRTGLLILFWYFSPFVVFSIAGGRAGVGKLAMLLCLAVTALAVLVSFILEKRPDFRRAVLIELWAAGYPICLVCGQRCTAEAPATAICTECGESIGAQQILIRTEARRVIACPSALLALTTAQAESLARRFDKEHRRWKRRVILAFGLSMLALIIGTFIYEVIDTDRTYISSSAGLAVVVKVLFLTIVALFLIACFGLKAWVIRRIRKQADAETRGIRPSPRSQDSSDELP